MSCIKAFLLILFLLFPLTFFSQKNAPAGRVESRLNTYMNSLARGGEFSGAVLVARNGTILLDKGYGFADIEFGIPNTPATKFKIGSLTKQFTAMAMLILSERKKISLQDSLCKYIPECPAAWQPVKLAYLLNHSSGIPDFVRLPGFGDTITLPTTLEKTIARLKKEPLDFPAGEQAHYGNSGLLLSAYIIEKVSGKSYEDFLRENIYTPLGMFNSGYAHNETIIKNRASGYTKDKGEFFNASYIDMSIPIGAGSQYSTVEDLYLWDQALAANKLISPQLTGEMFAPGKEDFGYGWEISQRFNRKLISHIGDINGFGAFIARYPEDKSFIVVLSNVERTPVRKISDDLAKILFGEK